MSVIRRRTQSIKIDKNDVILLRQKRLRNLGSISAKNLKIESLAKFTAWYTLHRDSDSKAFYISDKKEGDKSPIWAPINRSRINNDTLMGSRHIIVRIWYSTSDANASLGNEIEVNLYLFLETDVCFDGLMHFNEDIKKQTMDNLVVFEFFGFQFCEPLEHSETLNVEHKLSRTIKLNDTRTNYEFLANPSVMKIVKNSYPLSVLMRLLDFKKVIHETENKISRLKQTILSKYEAKASLRELQIQKELSLQRIALLKDKIANKKQLVAQLIDKKVKIEHENDTKSRVVSETKLLLDENQMKVVQIEKSNKSKEASVLMLKEKLILRQRKLILELAFIYPIRNVSTQQANTTTQTNSNRSFLDMEIFGVKLNSLQNVQSTVQDDQKLSIALGYVSHCLILLCEILDVPMRYPIIYRASKSFICEFPRENQVLEYALYKNTSVTEQNFRHAFRLLNKNLVQIRILFDDFKNIPFGDTLGNLSWMLNNC